MAITQHPVDKLQSIQRGLKTTFRSIEDHEAAFEIDRLISEVSTLILEAQVRSLSAPGDRCEDLLERAFSLRERVRDNARKARLIKSDRG